MMFYFHLQKYEIYCKGKNCDHEMIESDFSTAMNILRGPLVEIVFFEQVRRNWKYDFNVIIFLECYTQSFFSPKTTY